ncbi:MAG: hypothetical protein IKY23_06595 [Lachnospiraceae bacterium]|jgi:hypothetical protein|nr:hypothetical protein [Lachnospiraceae bacterium]
MKKTVVAFAVCMALISIVNPNTAYAKSIENVQDVKIESGYTRGDVIVTKYRVHNGYYQYRHWNATQGYWVEDDWITIA